MASPSSFVLRMRLGLSMSTSMMVCRPRPNGCPDPQRCFARWRCEPEDKFAAEDTETRLRCERPTSRARPTRVHVYRRVTRTSPQRPHDTEISQQCMKRSVAEARSEISLLQWCCTIGGLPSYNVNKPALRLRWKGSLVVF